MAVMFPQPGEFKRRGCVQGRQQPRDEATESSCPETTVFSGDELFVTSLDLTVDA